MSEQALKWRATTATKECPYCGGEFNVRGYGRHEGACCQRHDIASDYAARFSKNLPTHDGLLFWYAARNQTKHTYSFTDDEMEIIDHPPDEIDDGAGSLSGMDTADSDIGECHILGALLPGLIFLSYCHQKQNATRICHPVPSKSSIIPTARKPRVSSPLKDSRRC